MRILNADARVEFYDTFGNRVGAFKLADNSTLPRQGEWVALGGYQQQVVKIEHHIEQGLIIVKLGSRL